MSNQQRDRGNNGAGTTITEPVRETAGKVGEMIKEAASNVAQKTAAAGSFLAHKAEDATTAVGGEFKSLAGAMRDKGPREGMLGNANAAVASSLDTCGRELEHGLSGVGADVTNLVRRHPVPALLIGVGLGFLMARVISK
jgi:hypothetical protein